MSKGKVYMCPKCGEVAIFPVWDLECDRCDQDPVMETEYDREDYPFNMGKEKEQKFIDFIYKKYNLFENELFSQEAYDARIKEDQDSEEKTRRYFEECERKGIKDMSHTISYKPKCPTCSSTNVQKIGAGERVASVGLFGLFSKKINKTFKCKDCGYSW